MKSTDGSSSNDSSKKNVEKDIVLNDDDDSDIESDSESESDSEDEDDSDDDDEVDDEDPFDEIDSDSDIENEGAELDHVLANINSKLPKSALQKEKKHLINDKAEENLFGLSTSGKKLSLADMMKDMDEETNSEAILLPKSNDNANSKVEGDDDDEEDRENKAFSVPLPQSIQQRKERKAAYEIQKEEVTKWKDTILRNRQAEVLNFQSKKASAKHNSTLFKPIATPLNKLDSQLDSILDASNLESKKTEDLFDDIDQAKVSKAELLKRTNELRLMRELMYRGQRDSKRLKKIKSKTYRQKLRKEKLKNKQLVKEAGGLDDEDDDEHDPDYLRAKERMSLKHKNTSKWAKSMLKSGMMNDKENRDEMEEMLRQGERLKLKQAGKNDNESSDDDRDLSDLEKDNNVDQSDDEDDSNERQKIGKGVMNMDFMKNAEKREKLQNLKEIEELKMYQQGDASQIDKEMFGKVDGSANT
ncbi:unnamed protein product [Ambrosiozyma monospora]|uniref:Unnamed protein product n=1 Tax=Ambrosiozyma monospora TaxID=43982 RepID=A0A9W7DJM7_AMBMO|nr:unnamed protein product [Ambrosiozyma monospora]